MKYIIALLIALIVAAPAVAQGDPTPKDVEAKCLRTTSVSAPLPDPIKALTVYSKLSMFCSISLTDAYYHPETKLFYLINNYTLVHRKNDMVPFLPKNRTYTSSRWKRMEKVGSTLFMANYELERKVTPASKPWEWQAQATVSYQIRAKDHENNTPIWDVKSTGLLVSQITELRLK